MACYVVTGGAGFIGSNLVHALVGAGHEVRVVDDFSTGKRANLDGLENTVHLFEGSICDKALVTDAMKGADYCLHQAALASVPRSVEDPLESNRINVDGTLSVLLAARDGGVKRTVFASSSSVYGNNDTLPVSEDLPVAPISPYGVSKAADELYARTFADLYDMEIVALRYFNVFGPRQDPKSQYAAVIPLFITRMLQGESPLIHGDGEQSRDFSFVENIVAANLLACEAEGKIAGVYNLACGASTSILNLVESLNNILGTNIKPEHGPAREGDIRHSWADISRAEEAFGFSPHVGVEEGLQQTVAWYQAKGA